MSLLPLGGFSLLGSVRGQNRRTSCFHLVFQPCFRNAAPPTSGISPHVSPFACWWSYPLCRADPLLGFPAHEHPSNSSRRLSSLLAGLRSDSHSRSCRRLFASEPRDVATCRANSLRSLLGQPQHALATLRSALSLRYPAWAASGRDQKATPVECLTGRASPLEVCQARGCHASIPQLPFPCGMAKSQP